VELDRAAAERAISALAAELGLDLIACAEGIVRVANSEMLGALRVMSVERGIDPRDSALMPFGGAGPLHAAALAEELGISRILCPRASGVLCALGLAAAAPRRDVSRTVMLHGETLTSERLDREREALIAEATDALGDIPSRLRVLHELRYRGQSFELPVEESPDAGPDAIRAAFAGAHERRYGYREDTTDVELVTIRVSVWGASPPLQARAQDAGPVPASERRSMIFDGVALDVEVLRGALAPGIALEGPALCAMPEATLLIPPGWAGEVDSYGSARLHRNERMT
jgi:N-methylhydantoinase A